jgi:hypothetical protein
MNGLGKRGDIIAGVFEGDKLAIPRQRYGIVEFSFPAGISHTSMPESLNKMDRIEIPLIPWFTVPNL